MPIVKHQASGGLSRLDHYRLGRLYRVPICCVIRWIASSSRIQAVERGTADNSYTTFVPCGVFHRDGYKDYSC